MSTQIQRRRGTTAEHSTFTGVEGELTVDTTKDTVVVHDGATTGGRPLLREDQANLPSSVTNGLYTPGTNQVALSTNGAGRLLVDADGNVTVTGAVQPRLRVQSFGDYCEIKSDGNGSVILDADPDNSAANSLIRFLVDGSEKARITSAGLVGIGTSSPDAKLDCEGEALIGTASYQLQITNSVGNSSTILCSPQTNNLELRARINDYNQLFLASGGNVGIGTSTPGNYEVTADNLVISDNGDAGISIVSGASNRGNLFFADGTAGNDKFRGYIQYSHTDNDLRFGTNAQERFRCDSSGRLLVGTSTESSNNLLVVEGNTVSDTGGAIAALKRGTNASGISTDDVLGILRFTSKDSHVFADIAGICDATPGTNDYPGRLVFSTTADGASSPTPRVHVLNDGKFGAFAQNSVLISASAAAAGTSEFLFRGTYNRTDLFSGGTASFYVYTNGNVQNTNNSYTAISDIKLKENIVDASSQWDDIKALQVRNYNFKEGQTHTQIGLIAQEVEPISPGLVYESPDRDEDGNDLGTVTKSVNYSVLYMKAVKALQEAMERIETLEAKVAALESA